MSSTRHHTTPPDRTKRKTVLVCPDCGHESPTDGDWDVSDRPVGSDSRTDYDCPVCLTTVISQPVFGVTA